MALNHNRRVICDLIFSENGFSEEEIKIKYKEKVGGLMVDGKMNVTGYLERWVELGCLTLLGGRYWHIGV